MILLMLYCRSSFGGMAERFKAVVLKTTVSLCGTVGSNPTPSAGKMANWGDARVVEWGRLLSGYTGVTSYRRFESCSPRTIGAGLNSLQKKRQTNVCRFSFPHSSACRAP